MPNIDPTLLESLLQQQEHLNKIQHEIYENFNVLLESLKTKVDNQDIVVENQSRIISNQDIIVNNQLNIINNQKIALYKFEGDAKAQARFAIA